MRRILVLLLSAAILLIGAAGCAAAAQSPDPTPVTVSKDFYAETPQPTPEPVVTEAPVEEVVEAVETVQETTAVNLAVNPLTGEPAEEGAANRRPYAVMINNISVAQPQVGISKADMIWELMDEGGITRCMALFTDISAAEAIGSIRSARWYNVSVAQAFDAIFVHAGGSDEAMGYIAADGINNINALIHEGTSAFYRDGSRQSHGVEHSLFGRGGEIVQLAGNLGYAAEHPADFDGTYGFRFSENAADQCGDAASHILLTYAGGKTMGFTYDPELDMYSAEQFGSVYADNGQETVYFRNVLVLNANTWLQSDGLHLTIDLESGSDGYFCCGGKYIPIKWTRNGYEDCFHFFTADGTPLSLGVGRTFVAVQQTGSYTGTTSITP